LKWVAVIKNWYSRLLKINAFKEKLWQKFFYCENCHKTCGKKVVTKKIATKKLLQNLWQNFAVEKNCHKTFFK